MSTVLTFILSLLFETYIFILMLRLCMQKFGANYFNPISQFVFKVTEPVIKPFRRIVPGVKGVDLAIVLLMFILEIIELYLIIMLKYKAVPGLVGILIMSVGELGNTLINVFFYAAIIAVIVSWFPSLMRSPVTEVANLLAKPLFRPVQRIIPLIGGFDISPILVVILLKVIAILVFYPLINYGLLTAF